MPYLLGVGAAWLSVSPQGNRAAGGLVAGLCAAKTRGWRCGLLSLRGGDAAGSRLARSISARGVDDLGVVYLDRPTPAADRDGSCADPAFGLFEFGIGKQLRRRHFRDAAARADAILVDDSLPPAALARVLNAAAVPVLAIESGIGDAARLLPLLQRLRAAVMREATLRRIIGVAPAASLGAVSAALGREGTVVAVGEALSFRFSDGSATLAVHRDRRGTGLAEAFAAELAAIR